MGMVNTLTFQEDLPLTDPRTDLFDREQYENLSFDKIGELQIRGFLNSDLHEIGVQILDSQGMPELIPRTLLPGELRLDDGRTERICLRAKRWEPRDGTLMLREDPDWCLFSCRADWLQGVSRGWLRVWVPLDGNVYDVILLCHDSPMLP